MMHNMSEEEIDKWDRTVSNLNNSSSLEDRICGILMDMKIGSFGLHPPDARIKACAIAHLVEVWNKTLGYEHLHVDYGNFDILSGYGVTSPK